MHAVKKLSVSNEEGGGEEVKASRDMLTVMSCHVMLCIVQCIILCTYNNTHDDSIRWYFKGTKSLPETVYLDRT